MNEPQRLEIVDQISGESFNRIGRSIRYLELTRDVVGKYRIHALPQANDVIETYFIPEPDQQLESILIRQTAEELSRVDKQQVPQAMQNLAASTGHESIHGMNWIVVRVALPEFSKKLDDVADFNIRVVLDEPEFVVLFAHKDRPRGAKGHLPDMPIFEVVLKKSDLSVVRSSFSR